MKQAEEQIEDKTTLNHDWYVARSEHGLRRDKESHAKSGFIYVFGGSLDEVKTWIDNAPDGTRRFFSWVPSEFVADDLFNIKSYPS